MKLYDMDKISIEKLKIFAHHGCDSAENKKGQDFFIGIDIYSSLFDAGVNDKLEYTIDYAKVCHEVKAIFTAHSYKTLEKCATVIISKLFFIYPSIAAIRVQIDKPYAPIGLDFNNVSVSLFKQKVPVYIGLGSNLGDKKANLDMAIDKLRAIGSVDKVSDYIDTKPWGVYEQPNFLNAAVLLTTFLSPHSLLATLKNIEQELGREDGAKWGPRLIDIDILLYDDIVLQSDTLVLPHPYMHRRRFVLDPLNTIAPFVVHPTIKKSIQEIRHNLGSAEDCVLQ